MCKKYGWLYWSAKWILCKKQQFRRLMIDFHLYFIWMSKNTVNTEFLQYHFIKFGFTPPNAKQPLQGKKLQKKEAKKKKKSTIQEIS